MSYTRKPYKILYKMAQEGIREEHCERNVPKQRGKEYLGLIVCSVGGCCCILSDQYLMKIILYMCGGMTGCILPSFSWLFSQVLTIFVAKFLTVAIRLQKTLNGLKNINIALFPKFAHFLSFCFPTPNLQPLLCTGYHGPGNAAKF